MAPRLSKKDQEELEKYINTTENQAPKQDSTMNITGYITNKTVELKQGTNEESGEDYSYANLTLKVGKGTDTKFTHVTFWNEDAEKLVAQEVPQGNLVSVTVKKDSIKAQDPFSYKTKVDDKEVEFDAPQQKAVGKKADVYMFTKDIVPEGSKGWVNIIAPKNNNKKHEMNHKVFHLHTNEKGQQNLTVKGYMSSNQPNGKLNDDQTEQLKSFPITVTINDSNDRGKALIEDFKNKFGQNFPQEKPELFNFTMNYDGRLKKVMHKEGAKFEFSLQANGINNSEKNSIKLYPPKVKNQYAQKLEQSKEKKNTPKL